MPGLKQVGLQMAHCGSGLRPSRRVVRVTAAAGRPARARWPRRPGPPPGPLLSSLTKIITGSESKQPAGPNAHPLVVRHQPCSAAAVG